MSDDRREWKQQSNLTFFNFHSNDFPLADVRLMLPLSSSKSSFLYSSRDIPISLACSEHAFLHPPLRWLSFFSPFSFPAINATLFSPNLRYEDLDGYSERGWFEIDGWTWWVNGGWISKEL